MNAQGKAESGVARDAARSGAASTTSLSRSLSWSLLDYGSQAAFTLVSVLALSRFLDAAEFGIGMLGVGLVQIGATVVIGLFSDAIVQRPQLTALHLDTAFVVTLVVGAALGAACWVGAPWIAWLSGMAALGPVFAWLGWSLLGTGLSAMPAAALRRELRFKALAQRSVVSRAVGTVAGVAAAAAGAGVWSIVAQQIITTAVAAVALWALPEARPRFRFSAAALRDLTGFGVLSLGIQLVWTVEARLFFLLVGAFFGPEALGYMSFASRIIDGFTDMLIAAVNAVALPLFSRQQGNPDAMRRSLRSVSEFSCAVALPVLVAVVIFAGDVVGPVFGAKWLPSVPLIQLLCLLSILHFLTCSLGVLLSAVGRPSYNLFWGLGRLALGIGAMLLWGRTGLLAAAIVWVARYAVTVPFGFALVRRASRIPVREQLIGTIAPSIGAASMAAAIVALRWSLGAVGPAMEALAASAGIAVYAAVVFLLRPALPRLVFETLTAVLRTGGR
jgi:PST family polysaccharide transporter